MEKIKVNAVIFDYGNETSFAITPKGVKFLSDINKLRKISDAFGVPL